MANTRRDFLKTAGVVAAAGTGLHILGRGAPQASAVETKMRTMQYTSMPKEEALAWQRELRSKLFELLKMTDLAAKDTAIPLEAVTLSTEAKGNYHFHEMEMNSTPDRRMKFVLTTPAEGPGPFPAVLILAGHGGTRHTVYGESGGYYHVGEHLAKEGYITISAEISQHEVYEEGRTLMGERLWDLMRCVDYLVSRDDVDPERIASGGKSLGGEMVMWLGAMDPRVKANVVCGFLTNMDQMEENHCMCWKFPGLRELVDFADMYCLMAPRPLLCQNGLDEDPTQFPPSVALGVIEEIGIAYTDFGVSEHATLLAFKGGHVVHVPSLLGFFDTHLRKEVTIVPYAGRTRL